MVYAQSSPTKNRVYYVYDLMNHQAIYTTSSVASLLGYTSTEISELEESDLAKLIHPDDLGSVSEHYQKFYALHYGEVIALKYRMRRRDGSWCWLLSQETLLMSWEIENPSQVLGVIEDVTQSLKLIDRLS